ncbi:hypothetical protein Pla22_16850 [Rubripirellula amarantea]|uniref:Swiss Army Knife protein DSP-PTPase phosphatase domain-containing protein n=1 Tax=Rubripirellula amarantea TaxID=2527999 RepID=A0A5C5WU39_9BACT|nr:hypothetical protein [Rubripirellula amarantea]TWT54050.1 hypothetical protein Pla22_16850 [Rubripirellula amarantea]
MSLVMRAMLGLSIALLSNLLNNSLANATDKPTSGQAETDPRALSPNGQTSADQTHGMRTSGDATPVDPAPIDANTLEHLIQIHPRVICGEGPTSTDQYAELADLGVQTIISVDATVPPVEIARRNGIRYIHLPIGYDKIDQDEVESLAKAVHQTDGVIYIHCHHGKHRGPAAASAACIASGLITTAQGQSVLQQAGTGIGYKGLHKAVAEAKRILPEDLDAMQKTFVEIAEVNSLASMMSEVGELADRLKSAESAGWKDDREELAHDALLIREHFREFARRKSDDDETNRLLADTRFRRWIEQSEQAATELQDQLSIERSLSPQPVESTHHLSNTTFRLLELCKSCHEIYRD